MTTRQTMRHGATPPRGRHARIAALFGLLVLTAPLAAQPVRIDSFNTNQATLSDPPGGRSIASSATEIIGTRRGIEVRNRAGAGPTTVAVSAGSLQVAVANTTPDSRGEARVTWDGDNDAQVLTPNGLGGANLTAGNATGLRIRCTAPTVRAELEVAVYSGAANVSRAARVLVPSAAAQDILLPYTEFLATDGSGANFASVGAIALTVRIGEGSVSCDEIATSAPLLTATKVAALAVDIDGDGRVDPGDRVRYTVTIRNTGHEARNVDLVDSVDGNTTLVAGSVRATPVARDDAYLTLQGIGFAADGTARPNLLANDRDPDGGVVSVDATSFPSTSIQGGTLALTEPASGAFTYQPPANFAGADRFAYRIVDADGNTATGTANIIMEPVDVRAIVEPSSAIQLVGPAVGFTARLEVSRGGWAWTPAPAGTVARFAYSGAGAIESVVGAGPDATSCTLIAGGTCSATAVSAAPGSGTLGIVSVASLVVDGVQVVPAGGSLPVQDADPGANDSRVGTTTWVRFVAAAAPSGSQGVGSPYGLSITARVDNGAGLAVTSGGVARFTWNGGAVFGATLDSPGLYSCFVPCSVTVISSVPFVGTLTVTGVSALFEGGATILNAIGAPQLAPEAGGSLTATVTWQ